MRSLVCERAVAFSAAYPATCRGAPGERARVVLSRLEAAARSPLGVVRERGECAHAQTNPSLLTLELSRGELQVLRIHFIGYWH